jgi:hypothetical protein
LLVRRTLTDRGAAMRPGDFAPAGSLFLLL